MNSLRASTVKQRIVNYKGGTITAKWNVSPEAPIEVYILDTIGSDPWGEGGFTEADFRDALSEAPRDRDLHLFVNSRGGDVYEGFGIKNAIADWPRNVTVTITGVAASTASWMILDADCIRIRDASQMFIHDAMTFRYGNADEMLKVAGDLDKTSDQIAGFYAARTAKKSNKSQADMRALMKSETLMTGNEALALGLVDEITSERGTNLLTNDDVQSMRNRLTSIRNAISAPPRQQDGEREKQEPTTKGHTVNRTQKIALLNSWGVMVKDEQTVTDARIDELIALGKTAALENFNGPSPAKTTPPPAAQASNDDALKQLTNTVSALTAQNERVRKQRLTSEVERLINEDRIPDTLRDATLEDLMRDETRLESYYNKLQPKRPGGEPIGPAPEITGDSFSDVQEHILNNSSRFIANFIGKRAGDNTLTPAVMKEISSRAIVAANAIREHKKMLTAMFNANAIDADLQRQVIMSDMLEAYAITLLPLEAFSVKYESIPLEGTDEVVVPYFPLQANASLQFAKATGFATANDWTQQSKKIVIGGDGDTTTSGANATAGTAKDRLYQRIDFTSYDMRRQPYLNVSKLAQQAANKLGIDVWSQIVSRVIVTGNFGAAVKTVDAAVFSPDDIADLAEAADSAYWPLIARSLVLNHKYKTPLLKDNTFKQYLSYGSTDPIRKAMIQEAYGFQDMYFVPNLEDRLAANATGWINHQSAVLVGFAPIMPTEEVRALLTRYDVSVEPRSGCVLEYRKQANVTLDRTEEIIQSCFGAGPGVAAALAIIKKA